MIDMRPFMERYRPNEVREWYDYWYSERQVVVKMKPARKFHSCWSLINSCGLAKRRVNSPIEATSSGRAKKKRKSRELNAEALLATWRQLIEKSKKDVEELWSSSAPNLFAEKQFNETCAKQYPHCSVCQYFVPVKKTSTKEDTAESPTKIPAR